MVTFRDSQNTWQDLIKIYDTIFFNLIKKKWQGRASQDLVGEENKFVLIESVVYFKWKVWVVLVILFIFYSFQLIIKYYFN